MWQIFYPIALSASIFSTRDGIIPGDLTIWHFLGVTVLFGILIVTTKLLLRKKAKVKSWFRWLGSRLAVRSISGAVLRRGQAESVLPVTEASPESRERRSESD